MCVAKYFFEALSIHLRIFSFFVCSILNKTYEYTNSFLVRGSSSPNKKVLFSSKAEWKTTGDNLEVAVSSANTDKWTGIGFSSDRLMVRVGVNRYMYSVHCTTHVLIWLLTLHIKEGWIQKQR